jgi:hypothetical protein
MIKSTTINTTDLRRLLKMSFQRRSLYPRHMRNMHCRVLIRQIRALTKFEELEVSRRKIRALRQPQLTN